MIASNGIQHFTTKHLAEKMNFSEPAIYRHFKNKSAILEGILDFHRIEMIRQMRPIYKGNLNPLEKLLKTMDFQFRYFSHNPEMAAVIFSELIFQNEEALSQKIKKSINKNIEVTEKLIKDGQNQGIIRNDIAAKELTSMYYGSIRFTLLRWKLNDYKDNLVKESKGLKKMIMSLWK
jgi:AcrR family transcriptional regulator